MSKQITNEDFIKRSKKRHGDKYDYSVVQYKGFAEKVTIICPIHGKFEQIPKSHYNMGCRACSRISGGKAKRISNAMSFSDKVKEVHGNTYDYSKFEYTKGKDKSIIICPAHGEFEQTPNNHLQGQGCPLCGLSNGGFGGYNETRFERGDFDGIEGTFYLIDIFNDDERFVKVGITKESISRRFKHLPYQYNVVHEYTSSLHKCFDIEQEILKTFIIPYKPKINFSGYTECLQYERKDDILLFLNDRGYYE